MTVSYQEAAQQALQLHNQRVPYPRIADHLKSIGYISSLTKKPIGHLAVRQMVIKAIEDDKKVENGNGKAGDDAMTVVSPKAEIVEAIKKLAEVDLDVNTKLILIRTLVNQVA